MIVITDYYAYSDESHHSQGHYRSIALVQIDKDKINNIENKLNRILIKYGIKIESFKWTNIKTKNEYHALRDLLNYLLPLLEKRLIKIEVIIWHIQDSRHSVLKRDDTTNLSMMYDKLIKDFVERHLKKRDKLYLYADQTDSMNWEELQQILFNQKLSITYHIEEFDIIAEGFKVIIKESSTQSEPLIQIADIFAGMACTSYKDFETYKHWAYPEQYGKKSDKHHSNRDKYRFKIYKIVSSWNNRRGININLRLTKGFCTDRIHSSSAVNFWFYRPQHSKDKAPTKKT